MNNRIQITTKRLVITGLLVAATFVSVGQKIVAAQPPTDPVHAAHVASGAMPPDAATGDPVLAQQFSQLQAKFAQLEATLAKSTTPNTVATAGGAMPGMPGATPAASPAMGMEMGKMNAGGSMQGMSGGATPAPAMAGMSGAAAPAGGEMNMMGMMNQMMGMMDKMMPMPMGGGTAPAAAPMTGGGMAMMDDDMMEMAPMMGMGGSPGAMSQSALPGFPGASHLYHIGATGFFLDHPQHIALTTEQQAGLSKARDQALLAKSTADRAAEQAEQALWALTAADQPDATQIEAKIRDIEKLRGDSRLAFIHAVGDASKLLTDEQRNILTGFAPPVSAAPAAAPMAGGMSDM
ncbi:MAG TPA: hypothetical protein PJ991_05885 [Kiritimatiellia bacterium]|nr:hypothetical protein [Kiritimatiellia bacterium]